MSEIKEIKTISYPFLDKPVEIYETDLGHKIVFAHKSGSLINISTWVKTGSINETDENNGISHFLEHLMFKGTSKRKAGEFDKILESKGAIINAATWKDYTFYYITIPKGVNDENVDLSIKLHADMMTDAVIPENEVGEKFDVTQEFKGEKRERHVVIEEIGMRDDQPWTMTYNNANYNMYTNHPYKRDVIGTKEIISQISRDDIMEYYRSWYVPHNMTTIVVGDFDKQKVLDLIIKEFQFKRIRGNENKEKPVEKLTSAKMIENQSSVDTGFVMIGFHGAKASDEKGTILLEILSIILGEGMSSRLYQNLVEKNTTPVFNCIDAGQYQFKDGNVFFIEANINPQYKELAIEQIKDNINQLQTNGITEEELTKAKNKLKVKFAESAETVSEIGESIGYYMTVCGDLSQCDSYLKTLDTIDADEVKVAACEYLNTETCVYSVLMPN